MAIVRKGDTVLAEVRAAYPYFMSPLADYPASLRTRLSAAGFQVVAVDVSALSGEYITTHNWGALIVSLKPLTSDYASPQDVASIVAGAASASGFTVDFSSVTGRVVETATSTAVVPGYGANVQQNTLTQGGQRGVLDDLGSMLGISKGTLTLGALALGAVLVISLVRK